jgi:Uma2 family endonuclease
MPTMILPKSDFKRILRERRISGGDRYDEVWNGVYVMSPIADNEHQKLGFELAMGFNLSLADCKIASQVFPGCNVSDRDDDWTKNYRCPDVAVFLPGNPAQDRGSHWLGGPDFAVEIVSRGDRSRKKFEFYAKVGVHELLIVNRRPWRLELYHRTANDWTLVGQSTPEVQNSLASRVLPLTLRLVPDLPRPKIELIRVPDGKIWLA